MLITRNNLAIHALSKYKLFEVSNLELNGVKIHLFYSWDLRELLKLRYKAMLPLWLHIISRKFVEAWK